MSALLLHLLLLSGAVPAARGFSLCGWRNQWKGGNFLQYRFTPGDSAVTVENSAQALIVSAPFPASHNLSLQDPAGPYIFCVRFIPALQLFNVTYGITMSRLLHTNPAPAELQQPSQPHPLQRCDPASRLINVTIDGQRQPDNCSYRLPAHPATYDGRILESEITQLGHYLEAEPISREGGPRVRGWLERALSTLDFDGESRFFGGGALQAAVFKLQSGSEMESLPGRLGVSLTLPDLLLQRPPGHAPKRLQVVRIQSPTLFQDTDNSSLLGGVVLGVTLQDTLVYDLPEDVVITFPHPLLQEGASRRCVFWEEHGAEWSSEGCRTVAAERRTECHCNHLTYFAVLMQVSSQVISEEHLVSLTALTFAGCSVSALACLFTIGWICCSRKSQSNPTLQIHMNLLGALLLLDVCFMASALLGGAGMPEACQGVAMMLHFSLLCLFWWMAIEGFNLYRLVVQVFLSAAVTPARLAIIGWGIPVITVATIFLLNTDNYGMAHILVERPTDHNSTAAMCWLTDRFIHQVVNLGFFGLVLLFNVCMLIAMTMRVLRLSSHTRREKMRHCVTLLGLSCMLGVSWGLAFFSFGLFYLPIQYAFSILNTLQGLFIFLWYWALSQPHTQKARPSSDSTSATPASPPPDQTECKKFLT